MVFKDIDSEVSPSYNSAHDDIVNNFYNLVLSEAIKYDRISGFFNSTSLAIAARGIDKFIKNNGHMRLICGAKLNVADLESINNSDDLKNIIDINFLKDYDSIEDEIVKNHVKVLGWMVANNYLEIKIGVNRKKDGFYESGMIHSKIGIMYDELDDSILFDGSVNETAFGWKNNIESLKVFKSWKNPEFMENDKKDFENFWEGNDPSLELFDVPDATKKKLIEIAPNSKDELFNLKLDSKPKLRDYQEEAVENWINNNYRGIFSMATGTGKTFTALSCWDYLRNKKNNLLTIIVCPQKHLISQWESNLKEFGFNGSILIASGDNNKWSSELLGLIGDLESSFNSNNQVVVFTTFKTFASEKFRKKIDFFEGDSLVIVDEVHGIGSFEYRKSLLNKYNHRLGLSATPEIEDDFERTDLVYDYFNGIIYDYDLENAIQKGFLTRYNYHPIFVDLNNEEMELYKDYTYKISIILQKKKKTLLDEKRLNTLLIKRRDVINNAEDKFAHLHTFLKDQEDIKDLIIYCTGKQLPKVQNILDEFDISNHKFTGEESTKKINGKSERDRILELFSKGYYQSLVAIKCLDEGVDVPSTQTAFLMASTLNSRQHIQRRGRVLRKSPGKSKANIYDLIIFPKLKGESNSVKTIFKNEQKRYDEYADLADNSSECSQKFLKKWEEIT
ncbi:MULTISPECIES: DEAD/DEAH box helicase family protein [Methanobrevibacter]|jgi:DNA or RNA helicases of superfamily II|uniref:DNA repair helicase n=1 Tax=Methanobrevibacter smithii (strain ATCC 35061 / DSM 861 / OCM 144 / PS) TaxID=420247 RepID=A5UL22_METS3|nr:MULTISPECIES: DEAD/DEAH box helicase family protein [Methanobrevibacter]ABQ86900.1 DNA repair helicase [Methanobrevibacter smithii ATCC 35061]OED03696.1 hypothetical protein A9757_05360 [Methanobrevibacter sp. A54]